MKINNKFVLAIFGMLLFAVSAAFGLNNYASDKYGPVCVRGVTGVFYDTCSEDNGSYKECRPVWSTHVMRTAVGHDIHVWAYWGKEIGHFTVVAKKSDCKNISGKCVPFGATINTTGATWKPKYHISYGDCNS